MAIENCLIVHLLIVIVQPQRPIFLPDSNNCWWLCWFRIDNPLIVQYVLCVALELLYNGLGMELYDCCTKTCSFTNISKKINLLYQHFYHQLNIQHFLFLTYFLFFSLMMSKSKSKSIDFIIVCWCWSTTFSLCIFSASSLLIGRIFLS